jgi:hypothetical protein
LILVQNNKKSRKKKNHLWLLETKFNHPPHRHSKLPVDAAHNHDDGITVHDNGHDTSNHHDHDSLANDDDSAV